MTFKITKYEDKLAKFTPMDFIEIESRQSFIMALNICVKEKISFVDCFILARSRIEDDELFTFDKKILRSDDLKKILRSDDLKKISRVS